MPTADRIEREDQVEHHDLHEHRAHGRCGLLHARACVRVVFVGPAVLDEVVQFKHGLEYQEEPAAQQQ